MADQNRSKIEESLKTCLANLPACQTIKELAVPALIMIRQIAAIIRPDCVVELTPFKKDPQEIVNQEEFKEEIASQVSFWIDKLQIAIKDKNQETLEQIQIMLTNRASIIQSVNQMGKFKNHSNQLLNQSIAAISKEIEVLQNLESRFVELQVSVAKNVTNKIKKVIDKIQQVKVQVISSLLETRCSALYLPIVKIQDVECPQSEALSFENYLVAIKNNNGLEFNFQFKQGDKSDLKSVQPLQKIKIKSKGTQVKRAVIWYWPENSLLTCIELFDKDGCKLLEAGATLQNRLNTNDKTIEILLAEGERIIGFKSRKASETQAKHFDFQFILGKLV